jgi:hypothetical protein
MLHKVAITTHACFGTIKDRRTFQIFLVREPVPVRLIALEVYNVSMRLIDSSLVRIY